MEWRLAPLDTLFFRGPEPFNAGESMHVSSVFPPVPETMQGFVRTAILEAHCPTPALHAHGCGGDDGRCGAADCPVLRFAGPAGSPVSAIQLRGPYLLRAPDGTPDGAPGNAAPAPTGNAPAVGVERLFRTPLDIVVTAPGGGGAGKATFLRLGDRVRCDLGDLSLPQLDVTPGWQASATPPWLGESHFAAYLAGDAPPLAGLVESTDLWAGEGRVGIKVNEATHVADESMLYSIEAVRLRPGVSLAVRVGGLPGAVEAAAASGLRRLGGEGRLAVTSLAPDADLPLLSTRERVIAGIARHRRFKLVLLQPAYFPASAPNATARDGDGDGNGDGGRMAAAGPCAGARGSWLPWWHDAHGQPQYPQPVNGAGTWRTQAAGVDLTLLGAVLDRPAYIGGWDMKARAPKPLRPCVPAGAVYWFEMNVDAAGAARAAAAIYERFNDATIGEGAAAGFGHVVVGAPHAAPDGHADPASKGEDC